MKILALLLLLAGCAQVTSLNLKKHEFGLQPTKIIWFQVAGLEEEQIALLRFAEPAERRTSFEDNICLGKTWNYNLYQLRPSAQATFLSQITGKKNITSSCDDSKLGPIWDYLGPHGFSTAVLEVGGRDDQSLISLASCPDSGFLSGTYFWVRKEPPKGAKSYIYSQPLALKMNSRYFDRTCAGKSCTSSTTENFKAILNSLGRLSEKQLFIVRDFTYLEALEQKDFQKARGILADLERAYGEATKLSMESDDYLVLLTTGDSKFVDMPDTGKVWSDLDKKGSGASVKRSKLTNLVLATGSRAENFCGIYEDAQIFERILSGPKQQGLELKIINPFKL